MKKGVILSLTAAAVIAFSTTASAVSAISFRDLKQALLTGGGYQSSLDTNGNGKLDIFDLCREKSKIVCPENWYSPAVSLGDAVIDYDDGTVTVPVNLAAMDLNIKRIYLTIGWDSFNFDLNAMNSGTTSGSWRWSHSRSQGIAMVRFDVDGYRGTETTLFNAEFIITGVPEGEYSFTLENALAEISPDDAHKESDSASAEVRKQYISTLRMDASQYSGNILLSDSEFPNLPAEVTVNLKSDGVRPSPVPTVSPSPTVKPAVSPKPTASPNTDQPDLSEEHIYNAMIALKSEYPEGMRWTNDNYYGWKGGIYSGGYGCAGFAFMLSDAAFGSLPARKYYEYSVSDIRVGDILRTNNDSHSVIVLQKISGGVVVAEGNYNSSIHWGRKFSDNELTKLTYIMTRYPE